MVTADPAVTTTYVVTGTSNGCSATASVIINVTPLPTVAVTPAATTICTSQSTILTATGAGTYSWSPGNGLNTAIGAVVTASPIITTTYTVTGTLNGCTSTATSIVQVVPSLVVTATATPASICNGQSSTLSAAGANTYTWSPTTGLTNTFGATITAAPSVTTTYTVTGHSGTCSSTATVVVTVNPVPVVAATAYPAAICAGSSTTLSATGAATYSWLPAPGLTVTTGAVVSANPLVTSTYTVTGTTANGCSNTATVVVTVSPLPVVTVSPAAPAICTGATVSLTASGATTYTWTPSVGLNLTTGAIVSASPNATTTYTVTGSTAGCSSSTATVIVNVVPSLTVTAAATPAAICPGQSSVLSASGAAIFSWNPVNGLSGNSGATVTASPITTTTYTVTGTSGSCSDTETVIVTVNPVPVVTATAAQSTICTGNATTLTAAGAATYSWFPGTGLNPTSGAIVSASPIVTTTYSVTGTNTSGCTATGTVLVTVAPLPTVAVTPAAPSICPGQSTGLTASGAATYTWTPALGLSITTGAIVSASPATTTTYTVTGTTASGCSNTRTVTVTVLPAVAVTATAAPAVICAGQNSILTATGATTYSWFPANGLSATSGTSVTANPAVTTTYNVTGTTGGCSATAQVIVQVNPLPVISLTSAAPGVCTGLSTTITATGAATYSWSPATGLGATTGAIVTTSPTATITYTVTGTGANGCSSTATIAIQVSPVPVVTAVPAVNTVCAGSGAALTASGAATYSWSPLPGLSSPVGANVTASPLATTTYTVTGSNSGCSATATVIVNVTPLPVVAATATPASICAGATSALSASGAATYVWSPATSLSSTTGQTVNATLATAGTYTYTVSGTANSCSKTATVTVIVKPLPVVTVTPAAPSVCAGSGTVLTAAGATTYSWSPGAGLSATAGAIVTATPALTTTYTITGTTNGCTSEATVIVTVKPVPVISATAASPAICAGGSSAVSASGATTYSWSPAQGLNVTAGANVIATPALTTTYTVTGTTNGCSGTATVVIQVNPAPVLAVTAATSICAGSSATLTVSGAATYSWSPANGLSATTGASVTASPLTTITYTVTGTGANTCTSQATVIVTVKPVPVVAVNPAAATVCAGVSTAITASGATSYTWSPGAGLNATNTAIVTATQTVPGAYTYTVTGTTNGCSATATVVLNVNPIPTVNASANPAVICQGGSSTLSATGGTTYTWTPSSGLSAVTGNPVTASPNVTTTYTVTGVSNGCQDTARVIVRVNKQPTANAGLDKLNQCDTTVTLSAAVPTSGTGTWTVISGTGATLANPNLATTAFTGKAGQSYTLLWTVENLPCAPARDTLLVSFAPRVIADAGADTALCGITSVVLGGNNPGPGTGLWTFVGASTGATLANPAVFNTTLNGAPGRTYTLRWTVRYGTCQPTSDVVVVSFFAVPDSPRANDTIVSRCGPGPVTFLALGAPAGQYRWYETATGVTPIAGATSAVFTTGVLSSNTSFYVSVVNNNGCESARLEVQAVINALPQVNAGPDITVKKGVPVTLQGSGSGVSFLWTPATGLSNSKIPAPVLRPNNTGEFTYTLTTTSAEGCTASDEVQVSVVPNLDIPNGFTPNGDGVNETWEIKGIEDCSTCLVEIFDRWGSLVYRTTDYASKPWSGKMNNTGADLPVATFYYIITQSGGQDKLSGSVTIIK